MHLGQTKFCLMHQSPDREREKRFWVTYFLQPFIKLCAAMLTEVWYDKWI